MNMPVIGIAVAALFCLWSFILTYLAWLRPDRLVPPLWYARNHGYDLWITRIVAPVLALVLLTILLLVLLGTSGPLR